MPALETRKAKREAAKSEKFYVGGNGGASWRWTNAGESESGKAEKSESGNEAGKHTLGGPRANPTHVCTGHSSESACTNSVALAQGAYAGLAARRCPTEVCIDQLSSSVQQNKV